LHVRSKRPIQEPYQRVQHKRLIRETQKSPWKSHKRAMYKNHTKESLTSHLQENILIMYKSCTYQVGANIQRLTTQRYLIPTPF